MEPWGDDCLASKILWASFTREDGLRRTYAIVGDMQPGGRTWAEGVKCRKNVNGALPFPMPIVCQVLRRVARDAEAGPPVEDRWVSPNTSEKRKARALLRRTGNVVSIDVCAVDGVVVDEEYRLLEGKESIASRADSARITFLSAGRPDIQFCSNEASRCMASPTAGGWTKLKRIGRYLDHRRRVHFFASGRKAPPHLPCSWIATGQAA